MCRVRTCKRLDWIASDSQLFIFLFSFICDVFFLVVCLFAQRREKWQLQPLEDFSEWAIACPWGRRPVSGAWSPGGVCDASNSRASFSTGHENMLWVHYPSGWEDSWMVGPLEMTCWWLKNTFLSPTPRRVKYWSFRKWAFLLNPATSCIHSYVPWRRQTACAEGKYATELGP